jgi:hypothetical protein
MGRLPTTLLWRIKLPLFWSSPREGAFGLLGFWAFGLLKCVIDSRLEPVAQQSKYAVSDERCFVDHLDLPGCGHGRDYVYVCLEVVYVKPLLRFPC